MNATTKQGTTGTTITDYAEWRAEQAKLASELSAPAIRDIDTDAATMTDLMTWADEPTATATETSVTVLSMTSVAADVEAFGGQFVAFTSAPIVSDAPEVATDSEGYAEAGSFLSFVSTLFGAARK